MSTPSIWEQKLFGHFNHFHQSENKNNIPISQMIAKKLNQPLNFSIYQYWPLLEYWQGGYNRLKLPVKTTPGFDHPTLP